MACALTLLLCTHLLEVWTGDQSHHLQAASALGPEPRVGITGSPHVFASLHPTSIGIPSMSLTAPVCSYVCAEGIVRGNRAKVPQLEALLIEQRLESWLGSAAGRSGQPSSERTASAIHH